jgi:hypothetical protein
MSEASADGDTGGEAEAHATPMATRLMPMAIRLMAMAKAKTSPGSAAAVAAVAGAARLQPMMTPAPMKR